MGADSKCFCDGNGSILCPDGCDDGVIQTCGDEACLGSHDELCYETCRMCRGKGVLVCPAHGGDDGD